MCSCMVSLRSTLVPRLSVIFTIRENFRKFPPDAKFQENLEPFLWISLMLLMFLLLLQKWIIEILKTEVCPRLGQSNATVSYFPVFTLHVLIHLIKSCLVLSLKMYRALRTSLSFI